MIAVGLGCRKNCSGEAIAALVREALAGEHRPVALFSLDEKLGEKGLHEAARLLALPLTFLPRAALAARMDDVLTRSAKATRIYGLESISEAAALAGAGTGARLIVPRMAANGATCAVALAKDKSCAVALAGDKSCAVALAEDKS